MTDSPDRQRARLHGVVLTFVLAVLVIAVDQMSKTVIVATLGPNGDRSVIWIVPNFLRLFYVRNTGAAFGVFQGNSGVLTVLALAVVLILALTFRQAISESMWLAVALGLQFGGALGNVVDRLRYGFVVDFIAVPRWPTFNLADTAITIGVLILGLYLLRRDVPPKPEATESTTMKVPRAPGNEEPGPN